MHNYCVQVLDNSVVFLWVKTHLYTHWVIARLRLWVNHPLEAQLVRTLSSCLYTKSTHLFNLLCVSLYTLSTPLTKEATNLINYLGV